MESGKIETDAAPGAVAGPGWTAFQFWTGDSELRSNRPGALSGDNPGYLPGRRQISGSGQVSVELRANGVNVRGVNAVTLFQTCALGPGPGGRQVVTPGDLKMFSANSLLARKLDRPNTRQ